MVPSSLNTGLLRRGVQIYLDDLALTAQVLARTFAPDQFAELVSAVAALHQLKQYAVSR